MSAFRSVVKALVTGIALLGSASAATNPRITVQPQARILQKIDNAQVTLLPRTAPAAISHATDLGRLAANTRFNRVLLVLKSSETQEFALHSLLDEQQDKSSPNYHQWMTPEAFGSSFGVAAADRARITAWLQDSGLSVDSIAKSGRIIQFSGTSAQIEAAFHTEMHRFLIDGEPHVANSVDIAIPSALASVVAGVGSLNDIRPKANLVNKHPVTIGPDGQMSPNFNGLASPNYTGPSSGSHFVGAGDLATIFNTKPLLAAGIDGKGQKIGVIGRTQINLSDVQIYRTIFNLPKNDPTFTLVGTDPGTNGDNGESYLDVEFAAAVAPMASVNFVYSSEDLGGGGIDAAALYLVEANDADIISLSYGACEANIGAGENAFYNAMWEQAASQGQTVFVSSGDSGAATCDGSGAAFAANGYAVNGLGSTPFNVSVGGTMFNEGNATGATPYWAAASGPPYSTALGYIPEVPWNEGNGGTKALSGLASAGSGISLYYPTPSFQTGPGVPKVDPIVSPSAVVPGPHRYLPDVSLVAAAAHDATIFCDEGFCTLDANGLVTGIDAVGGTSVATPVMASVQALINQKNGGRQGLANYYYYRIAAAQNQAGCASSTAAPAASTGCAFHDVTSGNTNVPSNAAGTTSIGFTAAPGYDLAVGLGSADVTNLATAWSTISFNATKTTFTLSQTTGLAHGATPNAAITVTPVSGTGTPTGDVGIIAETTNGGLGFYTLTAGAASGTLSGLPAGTYKVHAHYAGDTAFGGSDSPSISVTVSPEGSVTTLDPYLFSTTGSVTRATTFLYGTNVYLDANVAGVSKTGTPTGKVAFTIKNGTTTLPAYSGGLDPFGNTYYGAGTTLFTYYVPTAPFLLPGTYTVSAAYVGDTTFNASSSAPFNIVVTPANQALALRAVSANITSGATATFNASITSAAAAGGGVPATGTVTFLDGTTSLGTATLANGAAVFSTTALTTSGAHSITAVYSGDTNYLTKTSAAVLVTVGGTASTSTLAVSAADAPVGTPITLTATLPTGATGTVFFYDNGVSLGGANVNVTTLKGAITVSNFAARAHSITAVYSGNATIAASTSAAIVVTITQNVPTLQLTAPQTPLGGGTISFNAVLNPAVTSPVAVRPYNPAPTGAIQFLDGTKVIGSANPILQPGGGVVATFTSPALTPGTHVFTASYPGDANFGSATSNTQTNNIGLTTTVLTSSTASVGTGIPFTLTARVAAAVTSTAAITGTVTFFDGTTSIGASAVTAGVATLTTATLSGVSTHNLTAVYSGDTNYGGSTSAGISVVTVTPTFTLSVNPTTLAVTRGTAGTVTVSVTSSGNYSGTAPLSCSGLPALATCTFTASSFTFNGTNATQTTTLSIMATGAKALPTSSSSLLWLPAILLGAFVTLRRRQLSVRGRSLLTLVLLACGAMAATGCGGSNTPQTPVGSSTITVTAVGTGSTSASPSTTQTATFNLTVQ